MNGEDYLSIIAADMGLEVDEVLEQATYDSVSPGICTKCRDVVESCEPDARRNYCGWCGTNSIKSALVLAGVI